MTKEKKDKKIGFILNSYNINVYRMNKWNFHNNNNIKIYDNFGDIAFQCKRKYMIVYYKVNSDNSDRDPLSYKNTCNIPLINGKRKREYNTGIYINILFQIKCMNYDMTKYKQKYIQKYIDTMFLYTVSQGVKYTRNNMCDSLRKYIYNGADIYTENNWAFSTCAKYDKFTIITLINQYKNNLKKNSGIVDDYPLSKKRVICGFESRVRELEKGEKGNEKKEKPPIKKARFELGDPERENTERENIENEKGFIEIPDITESIPEKITESIPEKISDIPKNIVPLNKVGKIPIEKIARPKKELCGKFYIEQKCIGISPKNDKTIYDHYKRCDHCVIQHYNNALKEMTNTAKFYAACKYYSKPLINVIQENLNNPRKIAYFLAINYYPLEQIDSAIEYLTQTNNIEICNLLIENGLVKNTFKK